MHEYWLQFFTAALAVYDAERAALQADDACRIYDKRVAAAEQIKSDARAAFLEEQKSLDERVFNTLPGSAPGVTLEAVRKHLDCDFDSIAYSLNRLRIAKRVEQQGNGGAPVTYYRKAV